MNAIAAIDYLTVNGSGHSEWAESSLWNAVRRIMSDQSKSWTVSELDAFCQESHDA